ncbi:unnamed protein product [Lampetra fluviatilis]
MTPPRGHRPNGSSSSTWKATMAMHVIGRTMSSAGTTRNEDERGRVIYAPRRCYRPRAAINNPESLPLLSLPTATDLAQIIATQHTRGYRIAWSM